MEDLDFKEINGWHVVFFTMKHLTDCYAVDRITKMLADYVAKLPSSPKVAYDVRRLTHMSSAVLGFFCSTNKAVREKGGEFHIVRPRKTLREVLEITKLSKLIPQAETLTGLIGKYSLDEGKDESPPEPPQETWIG